MPRVVIVNDASVARGGATGLALMQARMLAARGVETRLFTGDRGEGCDLPESIARDHAGTDPLMTARPWVAATRGLWSRPVLALLRDRIAQHDSPDTVYHVHSWSKTLTPSVFAALRPVAPRVFLHAHDFFLACPNGGYMDYRAMRPCARVPLSVSCLVTNCDKRSYAQKGWRVARQAVLRSALPRHAPWAAILMIHPGMAPLLEQAGYPARLLRPLRNPATALCPAPVTPSRNSVFLFIGRVEAEKGVEELCAAADAAGVPMVVIGDGPLRAPLAARHPGIRFTGWLDRPAIAREAAQARAVVMPSRYPEPFGLVAAEAALSGLPVIVSRTALLAPEIEAKGLGLACDTRDPVALRGTLTRMATLSAAEIEAMAARGRDGAGGLCLTPGAWIDAQLALYEAAISRARQSAA
ncbi:glycosyltransferase [Palleronia sediminis]|uniref:Glycosyltransferase n=1 Tax=Palleronia sediminis TaxID=2547833 RepID=A0A4R6AIC1_9RHOB|nr:glycosyltransferase family 4 protein [Palleronia sediminis]TDL81113.1 glycosyltransferase [Palleronia sediminis]